MSIKVTFQIPPHSPVKADELCECTYPTDKPQNVQNTVTEELLALGFTDASVEFERCVLTLDYFLALREGNTLLATAHLDPLSDALGYLQRCANPPGHKENNNEQ